jgi:hypothetical protein
VKRENQLNSHFLLHRLPFYVSFFSFCCLFIISLVGLLDCITFFLDVCTFFCIALLCFSSLSGSATATIRSGSLTFNHSRRIRRNPKREEENEKRVTSQGYNKTTIVVRSLWSSSLLSHEMIEKPEKFVLLLMIIDELLMSI